RRRVSTRLNKKEKDPKVRSTAAGALDRSALFACFSPIRVPKDTEPGATKELVSEKPLPGECHCDVMLIGRRDHLFIADRSARLNDHLHPGSGGLIDAVAEGEKRV